MNEEKEKKYLELIDLQQKVIDSISIRTIVMEICGFLIFSSSALLLGSFIFREETITITKGGLFYGIMAFIMMFFVGYSIPKQSNLIEIERDSKNEDSK